VKHHDKRGEQRSVSKRLSALERKVEEMGAQAPPRPEDVVAREAMAGERPDFLRVTRGNADFGGPVERHLERLQGRSRSELMANDRRGASSPLGMGSGSRPVKRGKER
jgi:hypothetical protein